MARPRTIFHAYFIGPFQGKVETSCHGQPRKNAFIMLDQANDYVRVWLKFEAFGGAARLWKSLHRHQLLHYPAKVAAAKLMITARLLQRRQPGRK
jgi:hypothetical protein